MPILLHMLVTTNWIDYQAAPYGKIAHIPAGVAVIPATNLPEKGKFWVSIWHGMTEQAESWQRNYGFLVDASQVTESPFQYYQRVRILPCARYPGRVRYGIIHGATQHPGMNLIDKDRPSNAGEWAYIVASYANPNAGALWFSADGLQAMRRLIVRKNGLDLCYAKA